MTISEAEIQAELLARGWVAQDTLTAVLERQQQLREAAQRQVTGTLFAIDTTRQMLVIQELGGQVLREIPLGSAGDEADIERRPSDLSLCWINPEDGSHAGGVPWIPTPLYGLVSTPEFAYVYQPDPLLAPVLGLSRHYISPHGAYDLALSENHETLLVIDRLAGEILILATRTYTSQRIQVRPQGSKKTLNIAWDTPQNQVFITDNQSSTLYRLDLASRQLDKLDIGLSGYALGNLALAPDGQHVYILTLRPTVGLMQIDLDALELVKEIPLKGELFSNGQDDPQDLMLLTPDQQHVLLMTYLDEPEAFTPVITLIQADKAKTLQRYAIKNQAKPMLLTIPFINRWPESQQSLLDVLTDQGLLTAEMAAELAAFDPSTEVAEGVVEEEEGPGPVPTLEPLAAPPIVLPAEVASPIIFALLRDRFYLRTEADINAYPDAYERLNREVERVRQFLETHDAAEVLLERILGAQSLEALVSRQQVLALIEQAERQRLAALHNPPQHCPHCQAALEGSWDCDGCGFELESPERLTRKQASSLSPTAYLTLFHVPVPDPQRQRLLMLDINRTLDWELEAAQLPFPSPWSALTLANQNLLIVDRDKGRVYEVGPSGKLKWALDPAKNPALKLSQPVKVTYYEPDELILIVDQGQHRVIAVDRHQTLHWQYGVLGAAGPSPEQLDHPSDIQRTFSGTYLIADTGNDRVLEVQEQTVVRSFGPELGLITPTFAERLLNGHTLIVDAGNYRVLEVDEEHDVVYECFYFKEEMGDDMRMDLPTHAVRGPKQNLILMDQDKVLELLPAKRQLIWSSLLEHLFRRLEIKADEGDKQEKYAHSFFQHKMPTMDDLLERMKKRRDSGVSARLMANFNRLLEVRRELDSRRASRPKVQTLSRTPLSTPPIYCLDRTYHHVLQLDRKGKPVWHFGTHPEYRLQRPQHVTETGQSLLIADTGNHRVVEVDSVTGNVLLVLGGKTERLLNRPRSAWRTLAGHTLIADEGNRRLVELDAQGQVLWEYKNVAQLVTPYFVAEQGHGTILFADWALQMVKEIGRDGSLLWSYGQSRRVGSGANQLSGPEFAVRLPAGSTLIADTHNNRVLEVAPNRSILWEFGGTEALPMVTPSFCRRLSDGNTLIAYDGYRQLIEVDKSGTPRWHFELGNAPMVR
jgi:DNA-binding beta-propeller fold protein YncE